MAVLKVVASSNSTKTTVTAVIRFFLRRHPKIADVAMIFAKKCMAIDAVISVKFFAPKNVEY